MIHCTHYFKYLPFAVFAACNLWFLIKKWSFIESCLSDKGQGSATRLSGFIFVEVVSYNEVFTTMQTCVFNITHLDHIMIGIGVLFGFIKVTDMFTIWKGKSVSTSDKIEVTNDGVMTEQTKETTA